MARIGNIEIEDEYHSGGAFKLNNEVDEKLEIELSDGWKATLDEETSYIVVQSDSEGSSENIFEKAIDAATRALDIFSITDDYEGRCSETSSERILWWNDGGESIIRFTGIAEVSSNASAEVTVNGETPEPTIPEWHESFRYYRLSKTTDDLFDAYRNQFLALEHLLTDMFEDESGNTQWLEWVLNEAHEEYDLSNYASDEEEPVESIYQEQYKDVRCNIFHAKAWEDRLNPRDSEDTELVRKRLKNLTRIYYSLLQNEFGTSPGTGGLTNYGFEYFAGSLIQNSEEVRINYVCQESDDDSSSNSEFHPVEFSESLSNEKTLVTTARISIDGLKSKPIQEISLIKRDEERKPVIDSQLENEIKLEGFNTLAVRKGMRHITESRTEIS